FAQRHLWAPVGQCEHLSVVAPQPLHFAPLRPNAILVRYDLNAGAENLLDERNGIADRNFLVRADVDGFADCRLTVCQGDKTAAGVLDMGEIARGVQTAEAQAIAT